MIDRSEFEKGWAMLQAAMPSLEFPDGTRELYRHGLATLSEGSFLAGILSLVQSPDFDNRNLPTLHELRAECEAKSQAKGVPYVHGIPLKDYLAGVEPCHDHAPISHPEAVAFVAQIREKALLLGPGNAGHQALLEAEGAKPIPATTLTEPEWDERRRTLLRQGDELLGEGDRIS